MRSKIKNKTRRNSRKICKYGGSQTTRDIAHTLALNAIAKKARKCKKKSFKYKGSTHVGKKHKFLGMTYKKRGGAGGDNNGFYLLPNPGNLGNNNESHDGNGAGLGANMPNKVTASKKFLCSAYDLAWVQGPAPIDIMEDEELNAELTQQQLEDLLARRVQDLLPNPENNYYHNDFGELRFAILEKNINGAYSIVCSDDGQHELREWWKYRLFDPSFEEEARTHEARIARHYRGTSLEAQHSMAASTSAGTASTSAGAATSAGGAGS